MLFHISNVALVITWVRLTEFVRSRVELIANILMRDLRFTDWLIMERADFISVDLRKNLPIGCAKVLPLSLSALRTITKITASPIDKAFLRFVETPKKGQIP